MLFFGHQYLFKLKTVPLIIDDLIFALKVCKHVKSNAIVLVNNKQTIGIGAGQMSRIDSTKISIQKQEAIIIKNISITRVGQYQKSTNNLQEDQKIKIIKKENELMITNNFDSFKIEKLKLDNGKEMTAKEFINGFIQKNNINLSIVS